MPHLLLALGSWRLSNTAKAIATGQAALRVDMAGEGRHDMQRCSPWPEIHRADEARGSADALSSKTTGSEPRLFYVRSSTDPRRRGARRTWHSSGCISEESLGSPAIQRIGSLCGGCNCNHLAATMRGKANIMATVSRSRSARRLVIPAAKQSEFPDLPLIIRKADGSERTVYIPDPRRLCDALRSGRRRRHLPRAGINAADLARCYCRTTRRLGAEASSRRAAERGSLSRRIGSVCRSASIWIQHAQRAAQ